MSIMKSRGWGPRKLLPLSGAAASALLICGVLGVSAQPTLPLPAPGASPAPATQGDTAAKARAAALAAKANVDITEAWTRATGNASTAPIYLHIVSAKDPDKLVGVEVAAAQKVELRDDSP